MCRLNALRRTLLCLLALMLCVLPAIVLADDAEQSTGTKQCYTYDDMTVEFVSGELLNTQDGTPVLAVYYDFTNNRTTAESFIYTFVVSAYQDGIECDPAYSWDFDVTPDDAFNALISIKNGATLRVAKYFLLRNTESSVDVELGRMFSFGSQPMVMTLTLPDVAVASSSVATEDTQSINVEFSFDEADAIATAALMEGKTSAEWLHDVAMAHLEESEDTNASDAD